MLDDDVTPSLVVRPSPCDVRSRHLVVDECYWLVREIPYPSTDRRAGTSLIFASESRVSRVRAFPAEWFDLSFDNLVALLSNPF